MAFEDSISEQDHVDERPFFDRALARGNFDVAVGLREAGDVARATPLGAKR